MDQPAPYHQGNLREALIIAGMELLTEGGIAGLTLRRAAARAGVSHAAPAHHFNGLPGLLTAIAARAFQQFCTAMETVRDAAGADPFARLDGICTGYLDFAQRHAGIFHLMFVSAEVDRSDPDLGQASARAYLILRGACLPFAAAGATEDEPLEVAVWSLVHGFALLGFSQPNTQPRPFTNLPGFGDLLARLIAGSPSNPLATPPTMR